MKYLKIIRKNCFLKWKIQDQMIKGLYHMPADSQVKNLNQNLILMILNNKWKRRKATTISCYYSLEHQSQKEKTSRKSLRKVGLRGVRSHQDFINILWISNLEQFPKTLETFKKQQGCMWSIENSSLIPILAGEHIICLLYTMLRSASGLTNFIRLTYISRKQRSSSVNR